MTFFPSFFEKAWVRHLFAHRFLKFGTVGASGTFVNVGVLYVAQEYFFASITPEENRLNASLFFAILVATLNNFLWNRAWTWADRKHLQQDRTALLQFAKYAMACWLGIFLQVLFTKLFVLYCHYVIANALAIFLSSIFNFLLNDFWTFRHKKK